MTLQQQFYLERAAEARRDAEAATLANVRERCRRAELAWTEMAERAERTDKMRAAALAEKSGARAAGQNEGGMHRPDT